MRADPWSLGVAAVVAAFALATLIFWIPADIESGVIETFRRRVIIGDALAPTVAAVGMLAVAGLFGVTNCCARAGRMRRSTGRASTSSFASPRRSGSRSP